jgi:hypothetical protein
LIKQALINAHNNPKYTPIKDATTGLAFFATPQRGADALWVGLGSVAAKIATTLGFQKGDDVLETLKDGSIFSVLSAANKCTYGGWKQLSYSIIPRCNE